MWISTLAIEFMIIIDFYNTKRQHIVTPHSALCAIEQLWSQMKNLLPNDNGIGMHLVLATYYGDRMNHIHSIGLFE